MIPSEGFPFIEYLQSIKEVHKMCISDKFDENYQVLIDEFKSKFDTIYGKFKVNMTLKIHVIVDHYGDYFKETGNFFRFTNGEHHEAIHHSLKVFEAKKGFHMKKNPWKSNSPGKMPAVHYIIQCFEGGICEERKHEADTSKKKAVLNIIYQRFPIKKSVINRVIHNSIDE